MNVEMNSEMLEQDTLSASDSDDGAAIHDLGYRKFEGERSGLVGAVRSLSWQTIRSILGLGRKGRHKVFPIIVGVVAALPAVVFLGVAIVLGSFGEGETLTYSELFAFSFTAAVLFAAMVAPEALVRDRRDAMFTMYLSTPLTRVSYLSGKVSAVLIVMMTIVFGPVLLALLGWTFVGSGPDGFFNWMLAFVRLFLGSLIISAVMSSVALACSSLTNRRAFASIAVILAIFGGIISSTVLVRDADFSNVYGLLDPIGTATQTATLVLGESTENIDSPPFLASVDSQVVVLGTLAWFAVGAAVVVFKYRKLEAI